MKGCDQVNFLSVQCNAFTLNGSVCGALVHLSSGAFLLVTGWVSIRQGGHCPGIKENEEGLKWSGKSQRIWER